MSERITHIQKARGCATLHFADGEQLRVPLSLLRERPVHEGDALDPAAYRAFLLRRGEAHALNGAVRLLSLCDRSEAELRRRLLEVGYPTPCVEAAIARLYTAGLLDDQAFAARWAQSRAHKHGRQRIARELTQRGVDRETVERAVGAISDEEQLRDAVRLTGKFLGRTQGDFDRKLYERTLAMLSRHGYDASIARRALQIIARGEDTPEDE